MSKIGQTELGYLRLNFFNFPHFRGFATITRTNIIRSVSNFRNKKVPRKGRSSLNISEIGQPELGYLPLNFFNFPNFWGVPVERYRPPWASCLLFKHQISPLFNLFPKLPILAELFLSYTGKCLLTPGKSILENNRHLDGQTIFNHFWFKLNHVIFFYLSLHIYIVDLNQMKNAASIILPFQRFIFLIRIKTRFSNAILRVIRLITIDILNVVLICSYLPFWISYAYFDKNYYHLYFPHIL